MNLGRINNGYECFHSTIRRLKIKTDIKLLPRAQTSFQAIRHTHKVYVDKSDMVARLAFEEGYQSAPVFLSRPRRFGKSLLCSTFRSFFEHGDRDFKGLKLEALYRELPQQQKDAIAFSRVVYLDFAPMLKGSVEEFKRSFLNDLRAAIIGSGYDNPPDCDNAVDLLKAFLTLSSDYTVVLIIDEYDSPLVHFMSEPTQFQEVLTFLEAFYQSIKSLNSKLLFTFITGVVRFSIVGLTSGANQANDITLQEEYATLLGYTGDEILQYFDDYVAYAAEDMGSPIDDVYARLKDNYDGFRMSPESEKTVHSPWSLLNFLIYPNQGFRNYWYRTGGQTVLLEQLFLTLLERTTSPDDFDHLAAVSEDKLSGHTDLRDTKITAIPPEILLTQAGYLTIKEVRPGGKIILGTPNLEVRRSIAAVGIRRRVTQCLSTSQQIELGRLESYLRSGDHGQIKEAFNLYLGTLEYYDNVLMNEQSLRNLIYGYMLGSGFDVHREAIEADGRCDLEVLFKEPRLRCVFEFKLASSPDALEAVMKVALDQITGRHYDELPQFSYKLLGYGVVIGAWSKRVERIGFIQS